MCSKRASGVAGGFSEVILFDLLENETVVATVVSDSAWEERIISGEDFEKLGPGIQDIVTHYEGQNRQGNFEWKLVAQRQLSNAWVPTTFAAADEVVPSVTGDGYNIAAPYSDRARLGVKTRLVLQFRATQTGGGAVGDRQMLSITVAVRPWAS